MTLCKPLLLSAALIAAMCGLSLWTWGQLPAGQSIATHFALDGTPNGFSSKAQGLFLLPAIATVITGFMLLVPRLEPRREHLAQNAGLFFTAWIGAVLLMAFGHVAILSRALGHALPIERTLPLLLAVLWILLGRQLGRSQSTFFVGIRTPWTLSSDEVWRRTHALAGRLFIGTGVLTLIGGLALGGKTGLVLLIAGTVITAATSTVASYIYWRRAA